MGRSRSGVPRAPAGGRGGVRGDWPSQVPGPSPASELGRLTATLRLQKGSLPTAGPAPRQRPDPNRWAGGTNDLDDKGTVARPACPTSGRVAMIRDVTVRS